jgi:hypothetical protein
MKNLRLGLVMSTAFSGAAFAGSAPIVDPASTSRSVDSAGRGEKLSELEVWLQRLVGRFRIEGVAKVFVAQSRICHAGSCYRHRHTQGDANCERVASGAGIHCAINIAQPKFLPSTTDEAYLPQVGDRWPGPFLDGAIILFGINPERLGIRFLLVDAKSIAYEAFGVLEGDSVTFKSGCGTDPFSSSCQRLFWFRAKADDNRVEMTLDMPDARLSYLTTAGYQFALLRLPVTR